MWGKVIYLTHFLLRHLDEKNINDLQKCNFLDFLFNDRRFGLPVTYLLPKAGVRTEEISFIASPGQCSAITDNATEIGAKLFTKIISSRVRSQQSSRGWELLQVGGKPRVRSVIKRIGSGVDKYVTRHVVHNCFCGSMVTGVMITIFQPRTDSIFFLHMKV